MIDQNFKDAYVDIVQQFLDYCVKAKKTPTAAEIVEQFHDFFQTRYYHMPTGITVGTLAGTLMQFEPGIPIEVTHLDGAGSHTEAGTFLAENVLCEIVAIHNLETRISIEVRKHETE